MAVKQVLLLSFVPAAQRFALIAVIVATNPWTRYTPSCLVCGYRPFRKLRDFSCEVTCKEGLVGCCPRGHEDFYSYADIMHTHIHTDVVAVFPRWTSFGQLPLHSFIFLLHLLSLLLGKVQTFDMLYASLGLPFHWPPLPCVWRDDPIVYRTTQNKKKEK